MSVDLGGMEQATREAVERVHRAYMACALWSSCDDAGEPLDLSRDQWGIAPEARDAMLEDVAAFLAACWGDTWEDFSLDLSGMEPEQIGHDFWLTRNGHGAGFWDRGLGELGEALSDLARSFGSSDLYIGDDGLAYVQ